MNAFDLDQLAAALDEDVLVGVDHHLGQAGVAQQRLDRPVAEDVVRDLLEIAGAVGRRHRDVGVGDGRLEGEPHLLLELGLRHVGVVQLGAEGLDEPLVHDPLEVLERVRLGPARFLASAAATPPRGRVPEYRWRPVTRCRLLGHTATGSGQAICEAHVMPSSGGAGSRWASGWMGGLVGLAGSATLSATLFEKSTRALELGWLG